jgi:hypothetical protein
MQADFETHQQYFEAAQPSVKLLDNLPTAAQFWVQRRVGLPVRCPTVARNLRGLGSRSQEIGHNFLLCRQLIAIINAANFRRLSFAICCAYLPWI